MYIHPVGVVPCLYEAKRRSWLANVVVNRIIIFQKLFQFGIFPSREWLGTIFIHVAGRRRRREGGREGILFFV